MAGVQVDAATKKKDSTGTSQSAAKSSTSSAKRKSAAAPKTHGKAKAKSAKQVATAPRQSGPSQERYIEIQHALTERGYYDGPADGVWDAAWVDALRRFQADENLEPDGKLGALSLIALGLGPKRTPLQMTSTDGGAAGSQPLQRQYLGKPDGQSDDIR